LKKIEKISSRRCWNGKGTTILNFSLVFTCHSNVLAGVQYLLYFPVVTPLGTTLGKLSIIHLQTSKEKV
jgi:hypothetical protein